MIDHKPKPDYLKAQKSERKPRKPKNSHRFLALTIGLICAYFADQMIKLIENL